MFKWTKVTTLLALCLMFVVITGARYSRYQPPQWIELNSSDSWAFRIYSSAAAALFTIGTSGEMVHNGTQTFTGAAARTGVLTQTGAIDMQDAGIYHDTYDHNSDTVAGGDTLTWKTDYGDTLLTSGTTGITVTLPTITAAMNGYELTVKTVSGVTTTLTPTAGVDAIEASQGTMTGTSDSDLDAAGDCATFIAVYSTQTSGVSSVWYIKQEDIS